MAKTEGYPEGKGQHAKYTPFYTRLYTCFIISFKHTNTHTHVHYTRTFIHTYEYTKTPLFSIVSPGMVQSPRAKCSSPSRRRKQAPLSQRLPILVLSTALLVLMCARARFVFRHVRTDACAHTHTHKYAFKCEKDEEK